MADIILIILFTVILLINISNINKINIKVYISKSVKIVIIITFILLLFISYITRNDLISYLISITASLFFVSSILVKGIGEDTFYFTVGRGLLIIPIKFSQVKDINIKEKNNKEYFELRIKSSRGMSYERFKNEDRDKVEHIIEQVKLINK